MLDGYRFEEGEKDLNDRVCRVGLGAANTALLAALDAAGVQVAVGEPGAADG